MTLLELRDKAQEAISHAIESGECPSKVEVSVQIDGPGYNSFYTKDIELHYDNNVQVSGCVLLGIKE